MADAKTRKPPEPRGLSISLPLPESTEVHELAAMAGHSTKAQVETALAEWLITEGLAFFRSKLAARAQERLNKIKAPIDNNEGARQLAAAAKAEPLKSPGNI
jgi:hypothetical protein